MADIDISVGELPEAEYFDGESILLVENQGQAQRISGQEIQDFAAQPIANLTVLVQQLLPGASATVKKELVDGIYRFVFGIPAGADGVSPVATIESITGGHRVTITDAEGSKSFEVKDGKDGSGLVETGQADLAQNDPSQPDYVKGRTHWHDDDGFHPLNGRFLPDSVPWVENYATDILSCEVLLDDNGEAKLDVRPEIFEGGEYVVSWNGAEFNCEARAFEENGAYIGMAIGSGDPFIIILVTEDMVETVGASFLVRGSLDYARTVVDLRISERGIYYQKLQKELLPDDVPFVYATEQSLTEEQKAQARENIGVENVLESIGGDTLAWDGNTDGLTVWDGSALGAPLMYWRVSGAAPTAEQISSGTLKVSNGIVVSGSALISADMGDVILGVDGIFISVVKDNPVVGGVEFPEKGFYCLAGEDRLSSLTIPGYTGFAKKKIKEEYIPESVPQVQTAAVGQTIVVSEVDSEGKPTRWEAKELGSGGFPYDNLELIQSVNFTEETKIFRVDMDYSKYQAVLATIDVNTNDRVYLKLAGNLPVFFNTLYNGGTLLIIPFSDTVAFVSYDTTKGSPYGSLGEKQISGAYCVPAGAVLNRFELQHYTTFAVGDKIEVFGIAR